MYKFENSEQALTDFYQAINSVWRLSTTPDYDSEELRFVALTVREIANSVFQAGEFGALQDITLSITNWTQFETDGEVMVTEEDMVFLCEVLPCSNFKLLQRIDRYPGAASAMVAGFTKALGSRFDPTSTYPFEVALQKIARSQPHLWLRLLESVFEKRLSYRFAGAFVSSFDKIPDSLINNKNIYLALFIRNAIERGGKIDEKPRQGIDPVNEVEFLRKAYLATGLSETQKLFRQKFSLDYVGNYFLQAVKRDAFDIQTEDMSRINHMEYNGFDKSISNVNLYVSYLREALTADSTAPLDCASVELLSCYLKLEGQSDEYGGFSYARERLAAAIDKILERANASTDRTEFPKAMKQLSEQIDIKHLRCSRRYMTNKAAATLSL